MAIRNFNNNLGKPQCINEIEIKPTGGEDMNNKKFEIFNYGILGQVRVYVDEGRNPWFCLNDVCDILGIKEPHRVIRRLYLKGINSTPIFIDGETNNTNFIVEGNLLRFITSSRKPEAKKFTQWVCDTVLPALHKKVRCDDVSKENEPAQPMSLANALRQIADFMESTNKKFENMDREIKNIKEAFNIIQNNKPGQEFYTVFEFAKYHDIVILYPHVRELGKKAAKYCDEYKLPIDRKPGSEPDTFINAYPYDVLKTVFEDYFGINL